MNPIGKKAICTLITPANRSLHPESVPGLEALRGSVQRGPWVTTSILGTSSPMGLLWPDLGMAESQGGFWQSPGPRQPPVPAPLQRCQRSRLGLGNEGGVCGHFSDQDFPQTLSILDWMGSSLGTELLVFLSFLFFLFSPSLPMGCICDTINSIEGYMTESKSVASRMPFPWPGG